MTRPMYMVFMVAWLSLALSEAPVSSAILQVDEFDSDTENWDTRDGELTVAHDAFDGGVLSGTFGPANPGDVITDAFRLAMISAFPTYILTAISFNFYSVNVIPSDLIFRIGDGSTTFFRSLTPGSVGGWTTYSLALDNQSGWLGGPPSSFTNVLNSATFYDIQLTQNGTGSQTFYVDNFQIEGELPGYGGGGGPSSVPEPGTMSLIAMVLVVLLRMRGSHRRVSHAALVGCVIGISCMESGVRAENFSSGASEWIALPAGSMSLVHQAAGNPDGSLAGTFSTQQNAYPQSGSFVGPATFITEQFGGAGDLRSCLLGFDFKAASTNPVAFRVRIGDGSSRQISRFLSAMIDEVDHWYSFRLSLASPHAGSWDGDVGHFDEIINNVDYFSIDISRNGEAAQAYLIDNVFVDALPDAGQTGLQEGDGRVQWHNLRVGEPYRVEASESLNPAVWTVVESLTATSDIHITEFAGTNNFQFFRMMIP